MRGELKVEGPWCLVISGGIPHADPYGRAEVYGFCIIGVLKLEEPWCRVISGGIRHADPHGRAEVRVLHERGVQTGGAMVPGNFWRNPTCRPPWESGSRGFAREGCSNWRGHGAKYPHGRAEVGVLHDRGAQLEGAWCLALSGGIRHADPRGRAEVGVLHERGAQTGRAMVPSNFRRIPTCRPPMDSGSRGFA